jgi:predicted nucleic-acid-binding protein
MTRRIADTNLILRYLVRDHAQHTAAAIQVFDACDRGDLGLIVLAEVLAECIFVLESFYRQPREQIARILGEFVTHPGIEMEHASAYQDGLRRYANTKLHFVDCVIASRAREEGLPIATFDQGFASFNDISIDVS